MDFGQAEGETNNFFFYRAVHDSITRKTRNWAQDRFRKYWQKPRSLYLVAICDLVTICDLIKRLLVLMMKSYSRLRHTNYKTHAMVQQRRLNLLYQILLLVKLYDGSTRNRHINKIRPFIARVDRISLILEYNWFDSIVLYFDWKSPQQRNFLCFHNFKK